MDLISINMDWVVDKSVKESNEHLLHMGLS